MAVSAGWKFSGAIWGIWKAGNTLLKGWANDITDRVSDTKKFKLLLDSAPDATIIATPEGIIGMANSRTEDLFGFHREDLVNMPLSLLTPMENRWAPSAG